MSCHVASWKYSFLISVCTPYEERRHGLHRLVHYCTIIPTTSRVTCKLQSTVLYTATMTTSSFHRATRNKPNPARRATANRSQPFIHRGRPISGAAGLIDFCFCHYFYHSALYGLTCPIARGGINKPPPDILLPATE